MSKHKHADVIKAWADGETIQYLTGNEWIDIDYLNNMTPNFHSSTYNWRIKPKSVTVWVNVYPDMTLVYLYTSKEEADAYATSDRIACVPVTYTPGEGL